MSLDSTGALATLKTPAESLQDARARVAHRLGALVAHRDALLGGGAQRHAAEVHAQREITSSWDGDAHARERDLRGLAALAHRHVQRRLRRAQPHRR